MTMFDMCVYHDNCHDGLMAAAIVQLTSLGCELKPVKYTEVPNLEDYDGKHVVLVDFTWKAAITAAVATVAKSITIIDHHKTAEEELGAKLDQELELARLETGNVTKYFDMGRSGAGLAWDLLTEGKPRHWLVNDVEDRDLWRFAIPGSREVHAWMVANLPMTVLSRREALLGIDLPSRAEMVARTKTVFEYQDVLVQEALKHSQRAFGQGALSDFAGFVVVECSSSSLISDLGHAMLKKYPDAPFAMIIGPAGPVGRRVSLRSEDGRADVGEVAKTLGGSGHRNAAGCVMCQLDTYVVTCPSVCAVKTPGVCGGRARVAHTRVPVCAVVKLISEGTSTQQICSDLFDSGAYLNQLGVYAALDYAREHPEEIEQDLKDQETEIVGAR